MKNPITEPTLIVDEKKCRQKISNVLEKAKKHNLNFRPHFKTHQSIEIGRWYRELGTQKITVSSMSMAAYFASDGWDDITVAFPANWLEMDKINQLSSTITLNMVVVSLETIQFLAEHLKQEIGIFIKIDAGYHRTGVDPNDVSLIGAIVDVTKQSDKLNFHGFLAHNGHTYKAKSVHEIEKIHQSSLQILSKLKSEFQTPDQPISISIGDTPGVTLMEDFNGVDEIRPGNFVFYDLVQENLGVCRYDEISVAMACPIVAKHPERNTMIIYGGGVHHSKEFLIDKNGIKIFGLVVRMTEQGWSEPIPDTFVSSISQEHGVIHAPTDIINSLKVGDIIGILPVHSCMTADLQNAYHNLNGSFISNHRS